MLVIIVAVQSTRPAGSNFRLVLGVVLRWSEALQYAPALGSVHRQGGKGESVCTGRVPAAPLGTDDCHAQKKRFNVVRKSRLRAAAPSCLSPRWEVVMGCGRPRCCSCPCVSCADMERGDRIL